MQSLREDSRINPSPTLRQEVKVIFAYCILVIIVTFPLAFELNSMLPFENRDTYTAIWQNWWMRESLFNGKNLEHADVLFYPVGLDTTLQPRRWVTFPIWLVFYEIFGEPTAYNLTVLLQTIIRAYAMYYLIRLFIDDRISAWLGGAVFISAPKVLTIGLSQPNTGSIEFVLIFMIFWIIALRHTFTRDKDVVPELTRARIFMIVSAITFSATLYQNIKLGVFAVILGGGYFIWVFLRDTGWTNRGWQISMGLFVLVASIISSPIMLQVVQYDNLDDAIYQFDPADKGLDIAFYVQLSSKSSLFDNKLWATVSNTEFPLNPSAYSHISVVSIIVAIIGSIYVIKQRRDMFIWIILLLIFFLLSLGPDIYFNGHYLDIYWTPYRLILNTPLAPIFVALRAPFRFQLLFMMCFSILFTFGWHVILSAIQTRQRRFLATIGVLILLLIEVSLFPISRLQSDIPSSYNYIAQLPEQGAIIHIPTGRHESKFYMYAQIFHHLPIVEGMTARMPPDAFEYVELNRWLNYVRFNFKWVNQPLIEDWEQNIQQLLNHGFRYVVSYETYAGEYAPLIPHINPIYQDEYATVYDLRTIQSNPPSSISPVE